MNLWKSSELVPGGSVNGSFDCLLDDFGLGLFFGSLMDVVPLMPVGVLVWFRPLADVGVMLEI